MNSRLFLDSLSGWARRACGLPAQDMEPTLADDPHLYGLSAWPELPDSHRTATIYRLLSVMTVKPVPRMWMVRQSGLDAAAIDALLQWLERAGALACSTPRTLARPAPLAAARQQESGELLALV